MFCWRAIASVAALLACAVRPVAAAVEWSATLSPQQGNLVEVALTNTGTQTAWARLPGTLLDLDLPENIFRVTRSDPVTRVPVPIRYTGPLAKRSRPSAADYIPIYAGQSFKQTIDLGQLYDISQDDQYSVTLIQQLRYTLEQPTFDSGGELVPVELDNWVTSKTHLVTLGGVVLQERVVTPEFGLCSASQQSTTFSAAEAAERLVGIAVDDLQSLTAEQRVSSPRYTRWFGAHTGDRFETTLQNLLNVQKVLSEQAIRFNCDCDLSGVYAYVRADDPYDIFLCPAFWASNTVGTDSQAGTIVHELSHFHVVAGTQDHVYGKPNAQLLAATDPVRAVGNADNHEYFVENTPAVSILSDTSTPSGIEFSELRADDQVTASIEAGESHYYATTDATRILLSPLSGDVNLSVYADPGLQSRLCQSAAAGIQVERCAPVVEGPVYIEVEALRNSQYLLETETATVGTSLATLQVGLPRVDILDSTASRLYRVSGAGAVRLDAVQAGSDLYILRDPDDRSSVECASTGFTQSDLCTLPENYNVLFALVLGDVNAQYSIVALNNAVAPSGGKVSTGGGGVQPIGIVILIVLGLIRRLSRPAVGVLAAAVSLAACAPVSTQSSSGSAGANEGLVAIVEASVTGPGHIRFSIENRGDKSARLPVWGTPFESPILGDYFNVRFAGSAVIYRGPLAKRSLVGGPVFKLAVGESRSVDLDLSALYDISQVGTYSVRFRPDRLDSVIRLGQQTPLTASIGTATFEIR